MSDYQERILKAVVPLPRSAVELDALATKIERALRAAAKPSLPEARQSVNARLAAGIEELEKPT